MRTRHFNDFIWQEEHPPRLHRRNNKIIMIRDQEDQEDQDEESHQPSGVDRHSRASDLPSASDEKLAPLSSVQSVQQSRVQSNKDFQSERIDSLMTKRRRRRKEEADNTSSLKPSSSSSVLEITGVDAATTSASSLLDSAVPGDDALLLLLGLSSLERDRLASSATIASAHHSMQKNMEQLLLRRLAGSTANAFFPTTSSIPGGLSPSQVQQLLMFSGGHNGGQNPLTTPPGNHTAALLQLLKGRPGSSLGASFGINGFPTALGRSLYGNRTGASFQQAALSSLLQQQQQHAIHLEKLLRSAPLKASPWTGVNADAASLFNNTRISNADQSSSMTRSLQESLGVSTLSGRSTPAALLREQGLTGLDNVTSLSESFPVKLHRLLLDLELQGTDSDVASFLPNGSSFVVHNPARFESEVMKKYFPRMNRFASFQRQLNLYDFRRISDGSAKGAYFHPSFNRDFPLLCREMKRTKIKGQKAGEAD